MSDTVKTVLTMVYNEDPTIFIGPGVVAGGTGYLLSRMGVPLLLNIPLSLALGGGLTFTEVARRMNIGHNQGDPAQDVITFYTKTVPYLIKDYRDILAQR